MSRDNADGKYKAWQGHCSLCHLEYHVPEDKTQQTIIIDCVTGKVATFIG